MHRRTTSSQKLSEIPMSVRGSALLTTRSARMQGPSRRRARAGTGTRCPRTRLACRGWGACARATPGRIRIRTMRGTSLRGRATRGRLRRTRTSCSRTSPSLGGDQSNVRVRDEMGRGGRQKKPVGTDRHVGCDSCIRQGRSNIKESFSSERTWYRCKCILQSG
ncbi:hypothetical protein B0H15DRAFT_65805 [Mycena belliarum]|uniref:Uncharacterized protein n=1 Tax=Mycena belliarum TaxID=1033014 RepID=A0AAD6TMY4_9AGAR|nr:hypothetical protein B0H15DRAFT_65805 [Mycena belliae]